MKKRYFLALVVLLASASAAVAQTKVIAHRGYWKTEGSAQNSLASLAKADSVGCYGSEFDVWMTPDGVVVVNHDATTNANKYHIEYTPAPTVLREKLGNGETLPTLDAYYAEAQKHPGLRLVCELKTHDSRSQERKCIKKLMELAKTYGLEDRVDYITFSKTGFTELIKNVPERTQVYYLSGDYLPAQVKAMKGAGIDYSIRTIKEHPEWIQQCHDLGMLVNIWTVDDPEDIRWCIDNGVDFITTNVPELVAQLIADTPAKAKSGAKGGKKAGK